jgi:hypothetical protein
MVSIENTVGAFRPEFSGGSNAPALGQRYASVVTTEIDPAQVAAYELFQRSVKAAEDKAGVRRTRRTTANGPAFTYTAVFLYDSFAQRASVPGPPQLLTNEYGVERAQALMDGANRAVLSRTFAVIELRPDLSRTPN